MRLQWVQMRVQRQIPVSQSVVTALLKEVQNSLLQSVQTQEQKKISVSVLVTALTLPAFRQFPLVTMPMRVQVLRFLSVTSRMLMVWRQVH